MTKKSLLIGLLFISFLTKSNVGPQGFGAYPNYYFVETGALGGQGTQIAINAQCFTEFYSIEVNPNFVAHCRNRFKNFPNVHVIQGDSATGLWDLIKDLNKPITFWLDAHTGENNPNQKNTPILEELEQIKRHPIKTHTILIDDMHCCCTAMFDGLSREDIAAKVMEINSDYVITYVPGGDEGEYPHNIMVAQVP